MATALAAALGGSNHGFGPAWSPTLRRVAWLGTYDLIGLSNLGMLAGLALAVARQRLRLVLLAAVGSRFAFYVALLNSQRDFRYVVYDLALTLVALAAYAVHAWLSGRRAEAGWLAGAVVASAAAAAVQRSRFALHRHFNHNDLFHVGQMLGLYLLYRAGRWLRDREGPSARAA